MILKVVQVNLKHSRVASDNLQVLLTDEDLDIDIMKG